MEDIEAEERHLAAVQPVSETEVTNKMQTKTRGKGPLKVFQGAASPSSSTIPCQGMTWNHHVSMPVLAEG